MRRARTVNSTRPDPVVYPASQTSLTARAGSHSSLRPASYPAEFPARDFKTAAALHSSLRPALHPATHPAPSIRLAAPEPWRDARTRRYLSAPPRLEGNMFDKDEASSSSWFSAEYRHYSPFSSSEDDDQDRNSSSTSSDEVTLSRSSPPRRAPEWPLLPYDCLKIFLLGLLLGGMLAAVIGDGQDHSVLESDPAVCNAITIPGESEPCALLIDSNRLLARKPDETLLPHRGFFPTSQQIEETQLERTFIWRLEYRRQWGRSQIDGLDEKIAHWKSMGSPAHEYDYPSLEKMAAKEGWRDEQWFKAIGPPRVLESMRYFANDPHLTDDILVLYEDARRWLNEVNGTKTEILHSVARVCRSWEGRYRHVLPFLRWVTPARRLEKRLTQLRSHYLQLVLIEENLGCWLRGEGHMAQERTQFFESIQGPPGDVDINDRWQKLREMLEFTWRPIQVEKDCAAEFLEEKFGHCLPFGTPATGSGWSEWDDKVPIRLTPGCNKNKNKGERSWTSHLKTPGELLRSQHGKVRPGGDGVAVELREEVPLWSGVWKDLKDKVTGDRTLGRGKTTGHGH